MTVQFKENRKTYKVKRFPASAAMNIKAGLLRQPLGLAAVLARGGTGAAPWVPPLPAAPAAPAWPWASGLAGGARVEEAMGQQDVGASMGTNGVPSWWQWGAQLATPGASGLAAWQWCRLGGTASRAVRWGAGCTILPAPAHPCLRLPAPSHHLRAPACAHPPTPACTYLPTRCLRSPIPACAPTPPTHACLHPDTACTLTLPTPAHPPPAPTLIPCLLLPTGPSQSEGGRRVPPSLPGVPIS